MSPAGEQWRIEEYRVGDRSPILEFLRGLSGRDSEEAEALLLLLMRRGNQVREPRSKALGEGLFELRGRRVRLFYMFLPGRRVMLLDGVIKKTDKIPVSVLTRLKQYQREVLRRDREAGTL